MKILPLILAVTFALSATAQDEISNQLPDKTRKNEIGLLYDPGISGNNPQSSNSIQYKRWVKPEFMAYRANIGYGKLNKHDGEIVYPSLGDTVITQHSISDIPEFHAGIGVEMQRHFYKKIYLYAAVDLYASFGSGTTNDILDKEVFDSNGTSVYRNQDQLMQSATQHFAIGVLPLVGIKLQFSRISFGTELTGIKTEYSGQTYSSKPTTGGYFDVSIGDFTQRLFVNYRF